MALIIPVTYFTSCKDDDDDHDHSGTKYDYHAHVHAPTTANKHMEDSMDIHVEFESHTKETIHNINITIEEKNGGKVIYNKPADTHVHGMGGSYTYKDRIKLEDATGFKDHTDYILRAKVWGHAAGEEEDEETVNFHVHPKM